MSKNSVFITGCSSGIGYATAQRLRQAGFQVIASCRQKQDVERLRAEGFADVVQLDLSSDQSIADAVEYIKRLTSGKLFALFNNGAYGLPGAVEDLSRSALRRQFEVNVFGTHELTRQLIPLMLPVERSYIIQNSSVLGFVAMPNRGAYIASKYALEGLTDTLRIELANTSIRCVLLEPGPITSEFRKNALAAFNREIDIEASRHGKMYQDALERLNKKGASMKFTLPADAVADVVLKVLNEDNPRARYRITFPTHLIAVLKRILSTRLLDRFILRFGSA